MPESSKKPPALNGNLLHTPVTPPPQSPRRNQPTRPKVVIPGTPTKAGTAATIQNARYANNYVSPYRQQPRTAVGVSSPLTASRAASPAGDSPKVRAMVSKFNTTRDERAPSPQNPVGAVGARRRVATNPAQGIQRTAPALRRPTGLRSSSAMGSYDPVTKDREARQKQLGVGKGETNKNVKSGSSNSGNNSNNNNNQRTAMDQIGDGNTNGGAFDRRLPLLSSPPTTSSNHRGHKRSKSSCDTHTPLQQMPFDSATTADFLHPSGGHRRSRSDIGNLRIDTANLLSAPNRSSEQNQHQSFQHQHLQNERASSSNLNASLSPRQQQKRSNNTTQISMHGTRRSDHLHKQLRTNGPGPAPPSSVSVLVDPSKISSPKKSPALRSTRGTRLPASSSKSPALNPPKRPVRGGKPTELAKVDFEARRATIQAAFKKEMETPGFRKNISDTQAGGQATFVNKASARKSMKAVVASSNDPMTPFYDKGEAPSVEDIPVPQVNPSYLQTHEEQQAAITDFEDVGLTEAEDDTVTERMKRAMDAAVKAEMDRALREVNEEKVKDQVRGHIPIHHEPHELDAPLRLHSESEASSPLDLEPPNELRITIEQETEDEREEQRRQQEIEDSWTPRKEMEERNSSIFEWKIDASEYIPSAGDQTPVTPMSAIPLPLEIKPSGLAAINVADMSTPAPRASILPQRGGPSNRNNEARMSVSEYPSQFGTPLLEITKMLRPDSVATEWSDFEYTPQATPVNPRTPGRQYKDWAHGNSVTPPPLPNLPSQFIPSSHVVDEPMTPEEGCSTFMSTRTDNTRRVISAIIGEYGDSPIASYSRGSIADVDEETDYTTMDETMDEQTDVENTRNSMLYFDSPATPRQQSDRAGNRAFIDNSNDSSPSPPTPPPKDVDLGGSSKKKQQKQKQPLSTSSTSSASKQLYHHHHIPDPSPTSQFIPSPISSEAASIVAPTIIGSSSYIEPPLPPPPPPPPPPPHNPPNSSSSSSHHHQQQHLNSSTRVSRDVKIPGLPQLPEIMTDSEPLGLAIRIPVTAIDDYQTAQEDHGTASSAANSPNESRRTSAWHSLKSPLDSTDNIPLTTAPTSVNTSCRGSVEQVEISTEGKFLRKRKHLLKELLDTEKSFAQDMDVTKELYKGTANACSALTSEDVKFIFGNIDEIVAFSKVFLENLRNAVGSVYTSPDLRNGSGSSKVSLVEPGSVGEDGEEKDEITMEQERDRRTYVGEVFGQNMMKMEKVYGKYCKEHDAGNARLEQVRGKEGVDIWLRACGSGAKGLTNAWDLESLLIKPVQRVLKYPLLLTQLLDCTPENHPDYTALEMACVGIKNVAEGINTQKKRKDIVDKMIGRKRQDSDIRHGITKVLARRTEKLKQSVGLSEGVQDEEYRKLVGDYNTHYVQIQMVLRDIEMYIRDMSFHVTRFVDLASVIREFITASQSSFPDIETKWRRYETVMRDLSGPVLNEHKHSVRTRCVDPLDRLIKLHESPSKIMQKREKKLVDYARYKQTMDAGGKVDKKTKEMAEAFMALNETLKDELPKLFQGTKKLVLAVLADFVGLQGNWMASWTEAVLVAFEDLGIPESLEEVVEAVLADQRFFDGQVGDIGIIRGELRGLRLPGGLLSPSVTIREDMLDGFLGNTQASNSTGQSSGSGAGGRRPSTAGEKNGRLSISSPSSWRDERRHSASYSLSHAFSPVVQQAVGSAAPAVVEQRGRSSSSASLAWPTGATVGLPNLTTYATNQTTTTTSTSHRTSEDDQYPTSYSHPPLQQTTSYYTPPTQSQSSLSNHHRLSLNLSQPSTRPASPPLQHQINNIYASHTSSPIPPPDSPNPFQSALSSPPSPTAASSSSNSVRYSTTQPALFLAASLYEFGFEGSRREGGFRYLTYVQGEIFDVVATKGEIWLARNQDDGGGELGWIWCKHFARLPV